MKSALIDYFEQLRPGAVLLLSDIRTMQRAFTAFNEGCVEDFIVGGRGENLTATLGGKHRDHVTLQLDENQLVGTCSSCGHASKNSFCVHLLTTCMMTVYCLRGSFMGRIPRIKEAHLQRLKSQLLSLSGPVSPSAPSDNLPERKPAAMPAPAPSAAPPPGTGTAAKPPPAPGKSAIRKVTPKEPWICLDESQLHSSWQTLQPFHYYRGPRQAGRYDLHGVSPIIRHFLFGASTTENKVATFLTWRSGDGADFPLKLRLADGDHPIPSGPPLLLHIKIFVNWRDEKITVTEGVSSTETGELLSGWKKLTSHLYYSAEDCRLGGVDKNDFLRLAADRQMRHYLLPQDNHNMTAAMWNQRALNYYNDPEYRPVECLYAVEGAAVPLLEGSPRARLHIEPWQNMARVMPEFYFEEHAVPVFEAWRAVEAAAARMSSNGTLVMTRKARRQAIMAAWSQWLLAPDKKAAKAVARQLPRDPCLEENYFRQGATNVLAGLIKTLEVTTPLPFAVQGFGFWKADKPFVRRVANMMALLRVHFGLEPDSTEFEGWTLPDDKLRPKLPALLRACEQAGIEVRMNNLPVRMTSFDFEVTATASEKELDWFALTPEVRCQGKLIPQEEWERMIVAGGWSDGETFHLVDTDSEAKLQWVGGLLVGHGSGRKKSGTTVIPEVPRLRILDLLEMRRLGVQCHLPPEEDALLESLRTHERIEPPPLPIALRATLRDYQVAGYAWMTFLYRHRFGGCLADDMGLGKTLQTICFLAALHERIISPQAPRAQTGPHLIVLPPTLIFNWRHEIERFYPGLHVTEFVGKDRSTDVFGADVVLTSYEIVRRDIETLEKLPFHVLIFDEAQAVKNLGGERSKAMRRLKGRFRLSLTGTPMENHAGEYYSILELALPGLLGDHQRFRKEVEQGALINPLRKAGPFVLRRTKNEILKDLPPKTESDIYLELDSHQKSLYTRMVAEVRQEVLRAYRDKSAQVAGIAALAALLRLRQICVSAALLDKQTAQQPSPKLEFLAEKLEELQQEGQAALVFSTFTSALDLVEIVLKPTGISWQRMDGKTPQSQRRELVETFQKPDGPTVFLVSMKTGGAGLNLTRASHVFHLDPWWNPAVESQATDRAHRIGQEQPVFVHRILMRGTIEEKMMLLKASKRELCERILSGGGATRGGITREDIDFLLKP